MADNMTAPPAQFVQGLKMGLPSLSDAQAVQIFQEALKSNPGLAAMDPMQLGKIGAQTSLEIAKGPQNAPVTVQPTAQLQTDLPSPYAGTKMAERNPQNPQAQMLDQFDPEAMKAAYADYAKKYQETLPGRNVSQFIAATGGVDPLKASREGWQQIDQYNMGQSIGQQNALQNQATSGLAGAKSIQDMAKTALEFPGTQAAKQQEVEAARQKNITGGLGVQAQQRLNQPNSPETTIAKSMISDQLKSTGGLTPQIQQMLANPNITAAQVMGFMDPKVLDAFKTKVGIAEVQTKVTAGNQANQIVSDNQNLPTPTPATATNPGALPAAPVAPVAPVAPIAATPAAPAVTPPSPTTSTTKPAFSKLTDALSEGKVDTSEMDSSKLAEADTNNLSDIQRLKKQALESRDPQQIIALNQKIAAATGEKYKSKEPLNINQVGAGIVHLGQSQLHQANQQHTAQDIQLTSQQVNQFSQGGQSAAKTVLMNSGNAGPKFDNFLTVNQPAAQQFNIAIQKLNHDAQALGIVAGGDNSMGGAVAGAGATVAALAPGALAKASGAALSALGGLLGSGQAITSKSDPKTVAAMSIAVQEVAAKKAALLAHQQAFADRNNGDGTGFVNSSEYKAIISAKPLVNPTTGEVVVPVTNDQRIAFKKQGYGDAGLFLGNKNTGGATASY